MSKRDLQGSMRFLLTMVEAEITRTSETESFLVRSGLLRDILKYAIEKSEQEAA